MRPRRGAVIATGLALVWLAVVLVPLYWMVSASLRTPGTFFTDDPWAPPSDPTWANYRLVLENEFLRYLLNSVVVTGVGVALALAVCLPAAYAIVRGTTWLHRAGFRVILLGLAVPIQATVIPVYLMVTSARMYDTLLAIVLPSVAFTIPMTVLILTTFLRDVPKELFEAVTMDGAGHWTTLRRVVVPLSRPALVTVAIYDGLQLWNGFLFPLILTQSPANRTLPLSLQDYQGQFAVNVPAILAAVILSTLPLVALYLVGRRQVLAGLTVGFSK
jgi:raffinose/stachyose/melibiose transport system permease protein